MWFHNSHQIKCLLFSHKILLKIDDVPCHKRNLNTFHENVIINSDCIRNQQWVSNLKNEKPTLGSSFNISS